MRRFARFSAILLCLVGVAGCDENPTSPTSDTGPGASNTGTSTSTLTATRFLAFGDSLTEGEVTGRGVVPTASYPAQLLTRLRSRYPSQSSQFEVTNAVILLTAVGEAVPSTRYSHADGMATEADEYIPKPIDTESLLGRGDRSALAPQKLKEYASS